MDFKLGDKVSMNGNLYYYRPFGTEVVYLYATLEDVKKKRNRVGCVATKRCMKIKDEEKVEIEEESISEARNGKANPTETNDQRDWHPNKKTSSYRSFRNCVKSWFRFEFRIMSSCKYCGRSINRPYYGYCDEHCEQRFRNFKAPPSRNELSALKTQLQKQQEEIELLKKKMAIQEKERDFGSS